MIARLIAFVRSLFREKQPEVSALNRKERRARRFASSARDAQNIEHRARAAAKRREHKRPSDNGAKYRRAYMAGFQKGGIVALEALRERAKQRTWKKLGRVAA